MMQLKTDRMIAQQEGAIGWITFNNPARRNAVSLAMCEALHEIVEAYARDDAIRVIVVKGAGDQAFVAPLAEAHEPFLGERPAGVRLDQSALVLDGLADEDAHAFLDAEHPPEFFQHVAQHAVGDGLAVHQHAVAVEQHRFEASRHTKSPSR